MPQITAIEPQKRKSGRFNLFVDGEFAAGVSEFILVQHNLKVGQSLSKDEISKIILKEETSKLMDKALRFLAVRPRSEKEVIDFLTEKIAKAGNVKYAQAKNSLLIGQIIGKLKKYKYLNDVEFAKWWVRSRIRSNPKSAIALKIELIKKGIDREIIDSALELLPDQLLIAQKIVDKRLRKWRILSNLELKKKVYQYLASRGFQSEVAKAVFANLAKRR